MLVAMRLERLRPSPKSILFHRLRILRGLRGLQREYAMFERTCASDVSGLRHWPISLKMAAP